MQEGVGGTSPGPVVVMSAGPPHGPSFFLPRGKSGWALGGSPGFAFWALAINLLCDLG